MPNKFFLTLKLMRADKPTGYFLVFFPALFGLLLAKPSIDKLMHLIPLIILGSITSRSAGSIINDLLDRKFDKNVQRTKKRPLANDSLQVAYAASITLLLAIISLIILLTLSKVAIYLGFVAIIMITIYPLMKRITYFPQVFLGFTFNLGALIAYAAATNKITIEAIIMYLACCSWTISYDTIYGFMDIKDDKKIGVKSLAIILENKAYRLWLGAFYILLIGLFILSTVIAKIHINYIFILLALLLLLWQVATLEIDNPLNCLIRFKNNNYVGITLSLVFF